MQRAQGSKTYRSSEFLEAKSFTYLDHQYPFQAGQFNSEWAFYFCCSIILFNSSNRSSVCLLDWTLDLRNKLAKLAKQLDTLRPEYIYIYVSIVCTHAHIYTCKHAHRNEFSPCFEGQGASSPETQQPLRCLLARQLICTAPSDALPTRGDKQIPPVARSRHIPASCEGSISRGKNS